MRLSDRFALAALFCVTALASAGGVLMLQGLFEPQAAVTSSAILPAPPAPDAIPAPPAPAPHSPERFAFVPPNTTPLDVALGSLPPGDGDGDGENPDAWVTEASLEADPEWGARVSASAPRKLPWQTPGNPVTAPAAEAPLPPGKARSLGERLQEISPGALQRLGQKFEAAKAPWPPAEIGLVAVKESKTLELHARQKGGTWTFVHRYSILAASGVAGPKLKKGDKQVPEGVYGISFLNPNSRYHVSLRVNYPNAFDRQMASAEGRKELGGDIMIHGKNASVGCLAIGDAAAEELFVLAASIGLPSIKLIIAPTDFRKDGIPAIEANQPPWLPKLYTEIASAMSEFKAPPNDSLLSFFWN